MSAGAGGELLFLALALFPAFFALFFLKVR